MVQIWLCFTRRPARFMVPAMAAAHVGIDEPEEAGMAAVQCAADVGLDRVPEFPVRPVLQSRILNCRSFRDPVSLTSGFWAVASLR